MKIRKSTLTPEVIGRHLDRNEQTWNALVRLGVCVGTELELAFAYGTAGLEADRELARFLQCETEYTIAIEPEGVAGKTAPMSASPAALGEWVKQMVFAGHEHGGCVFDGWTTTVSARTRSYLDNGAHPWLPGRHEDTRRQAGPRRLSRSRSVGAHLQMARLQLDGSPDHNLG